MLYPCHVYNISLFYFYDRYSCLEKKSLKFRLKILVIFPSIFFGIFWYFFEWSVIYGYARLSSKQINFLTSFLYLIAFNVIYLPERRCVLCATGWFWQVHQYCFWHIFLLVLILVITTKISSHNLELALVKYMKQN